MLKHVPNRRCGWSQLVNGGVAGEQVSFQVSSESVNRWRCSNGEWQTVPDARSIRAVQLKARRLANTVLSAGWESS